MSSVSSLPSKAVDAVLALIYPQPCAVCGMSVESRHDGVACSRCWENAPLFCGDETLCWKCGALSHVTLDENRRETIRCGRCDEDAFTAARAVGIYDGALRASILELKRRPHVACRLAELMCEAQRRAPLVDADLVIPVPLHFSRERERGFNQAAVLAQSLSRLNNLPVDEHTLVRRSPTRMHRAGMDAKARQQSLADAFMPRRPQVMRGKRVLLIDDVFTTGATASACAGVLKAAGAADVFVLTIARASFQLV